MKQSFASLCSEFGRRACYNLALIPSIPNDKIMKILEKDGYKVVPYVPTPGEITSAASVIGHGVPHFPSSTVKNREGVDVIIGGGEAHDEFRQAVRRAATQVYNLKP